MEANYKEIPAALRGSHSDSSDEESGTMQTFDIESEDIGPGPFSQRIKYFCYFLILTCWLLPLISYFTGPESYIYLIMSVISLAQLIIGVLGVIWSKKNKFTHITFFRLLLHLFFISLIVALVGYEAFGLAFTVQHNYDNCNDFTFNKVCKNRGGLMSEQMVLILLLPALDALVILLYIYVTKLAKKCALKMT
ncbi:unnamed protein product [Blepharisma stoltei]|uniref:Uncharacterized protein n=1 Tax=Blepharisma stoltei TaxID=1481888 RepID=A0AAU9KP01_9CILI|nr:unnamed protein product [Blepharisma stoltei]